MKTGILFAFVFFLVVMLVFSVYHSPMPFSSEGAAKIEKACLESGGDFYSERGIISGEVLLITCSPK